MADMIWKLRDYQSKDAAAVRALVLAGLGEHFKDLKPELNPDLDNLQLAYLDRGASIIVVESLIGDIIGCGILMVEPNVACTARIVRMSVDRAFRHCGVGQTITGVLLAIAYKKHFNTVLVETNDDWYSAIRLYQRCGFIEVKRQYVVQYRFTEVHMMLNLK